MGIDEVMAKLSRLYDRMDRAYTRQASRIGLTCDACDDNCCMTHFHHHTWAEWHYLRRGLLTLRTETRQVVVRRAEQYQTALGGPGECGTTDPLACPLYDGARCLLYACRPMICRLHGVPWILQRGRLAGRLQQGCHRSRALLAEGGPPQPLDRTELYAELADVERQARDVTCQPESIRFTIAEVVLDAARGDHW
jgi:hypothetical protein